HVLHIPLARELGDALACRLDQQSRHGCCSRLRGGGRQRRRLPCRKQVDHRRDCEDEEAGRGQEGALFHGPVYSGNPPLRHGSRLHRVVRVLTKLWGRPRERPAPNLCVEANYSAGFTNRPTRPAAPFAWPFSFSCNWGSVRSGGRSFGSKSVAVIMKV